MAIIWVTHDLGVVAELADRVVVMYAGQVVEEAPSTSCSERPQHPYTQPAVAPCRDPSNDDRPPLVPDPRPARRRHRAHRGARSGPARPGREQCRRDPPLMPRCRDGSRLGAPAEGGAA